MSRRREQKKEEEKKRNYLAEMVTAGLIVIPLTRWLRPDLIPMTASDVWSFHGTSLLDWLKIGWPILVWGIGVNIAFFTWRHSDPMARYHMKKTDPSDLLIGGFIISLWAGIVEEIAFRWLLFFGAFAGIAFSNWLFFGCLGFGLYEWMHLHIWGPFFNLTTFGYLEPEIFSATEGGRTWILGAAMVTTNAFFRDGHKYQGLFGYLNSWFIGMFFFYVMFHYGLVAAMFLHFSYDMAIFTTAAILHALHKGEW